MGEFEKHAKLFAKINKIGNIVSAILTVVELAIDAGPTEYELLMSELKYIQQMIIDFRKDVKQRFDFIDEKLDLILHQINSNFVLLQSKVDNLDENIQKVEHNMIELNQNLTIISNTIRGDIQYMFKKKLIDDISYFLHFKKKHPRNKYSKEEYSKIKLSHSKHSRALSDFATFACQHAKSSLFTRGTHTVDRINIGDYNNMERYPYQYINLCLSIAQNHNHRFRNFKELVNLESWVVASNAYFELALDWPEYFPKSTDEVDRMIKAGEELHSFFEKLRDIKLFEKLFTKYIAYQETFYKLCEKRIQYQIYSDIDTYSNVNNAKIIFKNLNGKKLEVSCKIGNFCPLIKHNKQKQKSFSIKHLSEIYQKSKTLKGSDYINLIMSPTMRARILNLMIAKNLKIGDVTAKYYIDWNPKTFFHQFYRLYVDVFFKDKLYLRYSTVCECDGRSRKLVDNPEHHGIYYSSFKEYLKNPMFLVSKMQNILVKKRIPEYLDRHINLPLLGGLIVMEYMRKDKNGHILYTLTKFPFSKKVKEKWIAPEDISEKKFTFSPEQNIYYNNKIIDKNNTKMGVIDSTVYRGFIFKQKIHNVLLSWIKASYIFRWTIFNLS